MTASRAILGLVTSTLVLGFLPLVLAHGEHGDMDDQSPSAEIQDGSEYLPTYFTHADHVGLIYSHIAVMTFAWVFVLPIAVVLSLARSRYTLVVQFVFLATNTLGLLLGTVYNAQTPDLYPNNAHHKIGWIVTWVVSAQVLVSTVGWVSGALKGNKGYLHDENRAFIPISTDSDHEERYRLCNEQDNRYPYPSPYRTSGDSGQGTEPNTESLRSTSVSSVDRTSDIPLYDPQKESGEDDLESMPMSADSRKGFVATKAAKIVASRLWKYLEFGCRIIDRIILPFGFVTFATGIITFGRFFEGDHIFNGLAHWIKGGVFFWLGLFTLGRWTGSFGDLGWAWNIRPNQSTQRWRPSAEFVESALIFFYGSTNIFLEHLGGWGGEWTARDMEHISITVLFIGGGLCGMLVESTQIRDLLNMTVVDAGLEHPYGDDEIELEPPRTYKFSLNPIPALVILLLGIMMSSHTQASMISSMIHKQWGNLLLGASFARGLTYVLMFIKPPKSILPSRPPTELLSSFGLISGGIIFMASSEDTVDGMIHHNLDEMFMYTVTMGLVGLLMAWEVVVLAVKGWAVCRERRSKPREAF